MKPTPPHRALSFLRWFCREDYLEEIEGDLTEVFEKQYDQSPGKAQWKFTWSVIRYFRLGFIKSFKSDYQPNTIAMFRHNLLLTFRNFKRYKGSFLINLTGLSTGLACALLIYLWVNDELSVDKFHEKDDRLHQAMLNHQNIDGIITSPSTPGALGEALTEEIPEIEYAVAIVPPSWFGKITLSSDDKNIKALGQFVGKNYFNMFSYDLIQGDKNTVLSDKTAVVISEELALKLFNTTRDIIGKTLDWKVFDIERLVTVSGIFKEIPSNSTDQFDFLLPYEVFKDIIQLQDNDWGRTGPRTHLLVKEGTNLNDLNNKISGFIQSKDENSNTEVFLRPYSDRYLYNRYENGLLAGGRIEYVRIFSIIAVFILVIACINFMNLSTSRASRRLKEIGVKKALGTGRKSLIFQYLGESILLTALSLIMAMLLVFTCLSQFNAITGKQLALIFNLDLMIFLLAIILFIGLTAGSYPAFYLSGFKPIAILKGVANSGKLNVSIGELWARKGLVVFQFILSITLIVAMVVVYQQITYIKSKNLGYNRENVIFFELEGKAKENLETFLLKVQNIPGIMNASTTTHNFTGRQTSTYALQWEGKNPDDVIPFEIVTANYGMIETLGIEISAGRTFSEEFGADQSKIIFNEAAIVSMGLTDPVGKMVSLAGKDMEIIGVAKNFHFESFHENIKPLFFTLAPENTYKIIAKIEARKEQETIERLQEFYQSFNPGFTFDYRFMDESYQALYTAEQRVSSLSKYFAGIAILISCLGLFGLAAFTVERKLKEIGIRKVLGATNFGIIGLLSSDFTKMVLVSTFIALPISYFITKNWLENFAYRIELEWWFFAGAGLAALLIAWFTVGLQTVKAARINPTECLRDE